MLDFLWKEDASELSFEPITIWSSDQPTYCLSASEDKGFVIPSGKGGIMKIRTLGVYVGLAVDPTVDWVKVCTEAAAGGYTSISIFLTTAFWNTGLWPWPCVNKKFDFTKINPDYRANFKRACLAAKAVGISLHLCFVDQFHSIGDSPGPDPFRQGLGQGDDWDEEPLYSSWDGKKYTWLGWDPSRDPKYLATPQLTLKQYKTIGAFGMGMQRFVQMIANVLKNTGAQFSVKWANETFGAIKDGHPWKSRGDRDECVIWMRSILRAVELEPFDMYFDFLCFKDGIGRDDIDYAVMHAAFTKGIRQKHKAKLEVHGILTVADTIKFGFTAAEQKFIKWSTDGDLRMTGDYPGLGKSALPDVDLKMDAKAIPKTIDTVMKFFNWLMPKYATYIH